MIRLTVLYNLAEGVDEQEFIAWRKSEHEKYVDSMPGVIRNEFSRIDDISPRGEILSYRFQTIVDWPDSPLRLTFKDGRLVPGLSSDILVKSNVHWDWTVLQPRILLDDRIFVEKAKIYL